MANNYSAVFKIEDLQKKLAFTLIIIFIFRLGIYIPISGLDLDKLSSLFGSGGVLGFVNLFSGGALERFSIFALGIIPYINASIIMQLLTVLYPALKETQEEGEQGRKKIQQYTRYLTIVIATIQSIGITVGLRGMLTPSTSFVPFLIFSVVALVAGTSLVMWLGELITEKGIGNGASIIIFVGIIGAMPSYINQTITLVKGGIPIYNVILLLAVLMLVMVGIVIVQEAQRNIPVQYAKRVVGRKMYGGQNTYLPMKINQGGVIPIIFASSVLSVPIMIIQFIPSLSPISKWVGYGTIFYLLVFSGLIFFFTFFYTAITFNPKDISDNIKKYGGFILGVRPGKPTADYLDKVTSRLAFVGASFLAIISILPMIAANITHVTTFIGLGGTALLIMVGVAIDIIRQIESILLANKYDKLVR
ncbi:MAG: preprotein translocase subunit SecY [Candidatus Margulisbacteria bacterium GWF2_35_9]|nr:MAG: preprotein translocase subunit SecY [Candidatus Margulisbacteria bacterium GWF2_35_9]